MAFIWCSPTNPLHESLLFSRIRSASLRWPFASSLLSNALCAASGVTVVTGFRSLNIFGRRGGFTFAIALYFLLWDGLNRLAIRGEKCSNKSARRTLYPSLRRLAMRRRAPALQTPVAMSRHLSLRGVAWTSQRFHQNVPTRLCPKLMRFRATSALPLGAS